MFWLCAERRIRLLEYLSGAMNTKISPTTIWLSLYFDLRVSEPNVIFTPIINIPAEVIEQELAQGHVKKLPFSLRIGPHMLKFWSFALFQCFEGVIKRAQ